MFTLIFFLMKMNAIININVFSKANSRKKIIDHIFSRILKRNCIFFLHHNYYSFYGKNITYEIYKL